MDYPVNNNTMEVEPSPRHKRKRECHNVYMNPALDLLINDDKICNNLMEVAPSKRRKRSRSCEPRIAFENPALELANQPQYHLKSLVKKQDLSVISECDNDSNSVQNYNEDEVVMEEKSLRFRNRMVESTPLHPHYEKQTSFNLSFIEKIEIDNSGEALYLDDDLNESNIMEIKTITTIVQNNKKVDKPIPVKKNTNPFLDSYTEDIIETGEQVQHIASDFPFDIPVVANNSAISNNSAIANNSDIRDESVVISSCEETNSQNDVSYDDITENVLARRLFDNDSIQYADDSSIVEEFLEPDPRQLSLKFVSNAEKLSNEPVFVFGNNTLDKQSKILGCDVRNMSRNDIFNMESCKVETEKIAETETKPVMECEKQIKCKKSTNILSKIKDVFKHNKKPTFGTSAENPYEVVRKSFREKKKPVAPLACFENPALNLNTQDNEDAEIGSNFTENCEFNVTPMKKGFNKENFYDSDCIDLSDYSCNPSIVNRKHVRFDTTLNHEKIITGNSFDSGKDVVVNVIRSNRHLDYLNIDHLDSQIDEYHNELENCFNEKKFIKQNL